MSTISKPGIFNPNTYASILNTVFDGKNLFAPTMGWNSYQLAYYQTNFEQFVADIERYLSGLPVLARPNSLAYRFQKFMERHTLAVAGVVGLARYS